MRCLISGTAAAASGTLTVMRTSSEPACASSMHCLAVPAGSAVSVLVIDWMTMGAPPPTVTRPTLTACVLCRSITLLLLGILGSPQSITHPGAALELGGRIRGGGCAPRGCLNRG